jgi:tRNA-Thr(GGU) m(6)t(6)A37 methyltransferase TsaA
MRLFRRKDEPPPIPTEPVRLAPIGVVQNKVKTPRPHGWEDVESTIWLDEALALRLAGLEGFSHVIVVAYAHLIAEDAPVPDTCNMRDRAEVGLLATRSQLRPNHLLVTTCRLLSVEGTKLKVRGLDAVDGTPVLDVKPYLPRWDSPKDAHVPDWTV